MTAISASWTFPNNKKTKDRKKIVYPSIPSSIAPVNHGPELLIPQPSNNACYIINPSEDDDADFEVDTHCSSKDPHFPNQNELHDLTRDLSLTKAKAEILSSRLKEWNLLALSCKISKPRKRHVAFANFYAMSSDSDHPSLCYCTDIQGLFQEIGIAYSASDWSLFIDSSKRSLKAVLLHNGNVYPSIPIAHSVQMKENRESVKILLELIQYNDHNWDVCGDIKVIAFFWDCKEIIQSILVFLSSQTQTIGSTRPVSPSLGLFSGAYPTSREPNHRDVDLHLWLVPLEHLTGRRC